MPAIPCVAPPRAPMIFPMDSEILAWRGSHLFGTFVGWAALEAAVGCLVATACVYVGWKQRHAYWPPPPAPPRDSGEGPYRSQLADHRLARRPPPLVKAATVSALLFGQLSIAGALLALGLSGLLAIDSRARADLLLAKGLALIAVVAVAAGVHLLRCGPSLMARSEAAVPLAGKAAGWSMGLGVALFVLLFAVLGGAIGQHQGWLCLWLLGASLASIAEGILLNSAVEVLSDEAAQEL